MEGRDFRESDKDGSERVVIVSQSVAKALFPGQDPLNRNFMWTDPVLKFIGIGLYRASTDASSSVVHLNFDDRGTSFHSRACRCFSR